MSLFSRKSDANSPAVTLNDQEGVLALLFLIVTADGTISQAEEELVIATSNRMKLLHKLSVDDFNDAVQKVRDSIEASGREKVFTAAVVAVPEDLRETVYALAADIAFAEGATQVEEIDFLRMLQETFGLSDAFATKVLEVMQIKNRG